MRFSIRRLFAIVTLIAVVLAIGLMLTADWRRQLAIQDDLKSQGASWVGFSPAESDLIPSVLFSNPIDEDIQHHDRLRMVELKGYDVSPNCLKKLSRLSHIDNLHVISCGVNDDDLVHLPEIKVTSLLFWNAKISDSSIDAIAQIDGLEKVCFKSTRVTQQGVDRLRSILPDVEVILVR